MNLVYSRHESLNIKTLNYYMVGFGVRRDGSEKVSLIVFHKECHRVQHFSMRNYFQVLYCLFGTISLPKFRCLCEHIHNIMAQSRKMHKKCHLQEISSYGWHFAEHIEIKYTLHFNIIWIRHRTTEILLVKSEI